MVRPARGRVNGIQWRLCSCSFSCWRITAAHSNVFVAPESLSIVVFDLEKLFANSGVTQTMWRGAVNCNSRSDVLGQVCELRESKQIELPNTNTFDNIQTEIHNL